jgi:hypothetical protein
MNFYHQLFHPSSKYSKNRPYSIQGKAKGRTGKKLRT